MSGTPRGISDAGSDALRSPPRQLMDPEAVKHDREIAFLNGMIVGLILGGLLSIACVVVVG